MEPGDEPRSNDNWSEYRRSTDDGVTWSFPRSLDLFTSAGYSGRETLYVLTPVAGIQESPTAPSIAAEGEVMIRQTLLVRTTVPARSFSLSVHDVLGRTVRNDSDLEIAYDGATEVSLDGLPGGHYYCRIAVGGRIVTGTIVVAE